MSSSSKIPVTVLGGWLGAGKTTMVNRMLAAATERIAVIVNDVGEINIDGALISAGDPDNDDIVELTNGCICCKVGDDLYATLAELSRRDPAPERVVVEASGVAEPRQAAGFLDHPSFAIDAVISLAAGGGFTHRSSGPPYGSLMRAQLAGADLVVATKLDLLDSDADRQAALDELREFTKAQVVASNEDPAWIDAVMLGAHTNADHRQADGSSVPVATSTWSPTGMVDAIGVKSALRSSGLLRAKGSIATDQGDLIVHLAGQRVTTTPLDDDTVPLNAIVLIGESLDQVLSAGKALNDAVIGDTGN